MDEIDFDVDKIDAFAKSVFNSEKSSDTKVKLEGMNPELATRLEKAKYAYKEKYGKDLPVESGVRSREEQQHLYNRWESGDKSVYMPLNPDEHPDKEVFHTNAVDISSSVPEEFLNQFGIHRPLGNRDPVHAELMPNFKSDVITSQKPTNSPEPQDENNIDFNVDKIEEFAKDVQSSPPPPKKSEILGGGLLRGIASVADTAYGVVPGVAGMVGYAGARATGQTPQEAKQTETKISSFLDNPVGKAFGITETPEYKGEASRRLVNFIGENVDKGSDWISEKTGLTKEDVEFYLNAAMTAAPGLKDTAVGKAVGREAGYVAGAAKDAVRSVGDTVAPVIPNSIKKAGASLKDIASRQFEKPVEAENVPRLTTNSVEEGTQVTGGLPIQNEKTNLNFNPTDPQTPQTIKAALEKASPELRDSHKNIPAEKMNTKAIAKRIDADELGISLSEGQATGDVVKISREQNDPKNAHFFNQQNTALAQRLEDVKKEASPNIPSTIKKIELGENVKNAYKEKYNILNEPVKEAYKKLEDASGFQLKVDATEMVNNIDKELNRKGQSTYLNKDVAKAFKNIKKSKSMTFEQLEALRTDLATEMRRAERAGDGNAAKAAFTARQAIEDTPFLDIPEKLKSLASEARRLNREKMQILKNDPAFEAAAYDSVSPDKFLDKYVIKGDNKTINTMINNLGKDSFAHQNIKYYVTDHLAEKTGITNGTNFNQKSYNSALKNLSEFKKLDAIYDAGTKAKLERIGRVGFDVQHQPKGNFINNSKTFVASQAVKEAETLATKGPTKYGLSKVASFLDDRAGGKSRKASFAPNAGSSLKDIRNLGKK